MIKFKKALSVGLCVMMIASTANATIVHAKEKAISIVVNGKPIVSDVSPVLDTASGRVLVPMRAIFEALGYKVYWDEMQQKAVATLETDTAKISAYVSLGYNVLGVSYTDWQTAQAKTNTNHDDYYNNFDFELPLDKNNPTKIIDGRTMLPTRMIAESLGAKVDWDANTNVVNINTQGAKITLSKGWEKAISDHYKVVSPNQAYVPNHDFEGAYNGNFTFNGVKGGHSESSSHSTPNATPTPQTITSTKTKVYKVFDMFMGVDIEYTYNHAVATSPPIVGSFPAKILIDESKKTHSYLKSPELDPNDWRNHIENLTPFYKQSGLSFGGCNWYAESRFWEVTGIPIPHFRESDKKKFLKAEDYLNTADQYDELLAFRDKNDIQSYSIAISTSDTANHVSFVEYVERDSNGKPTNVYITEANVNGNGTYRYGIDGMVKKYSFEDFKTSGNQQYQGCIVPNTEFYK